MSEYENLEFKIPVESEEYMKDSELVLKNVNLIIRTAIEEGRNKIFINTNLKAGIPMENINKIAGPFVEAWAYEIFLDVFEDKSNNYKLIGIEAGSRLSMADVILHFSKEDIVSTFINANIDVKATSQDIPNSGKSPNITSFSKIRTIYVSDPDYIFIILSLKHKVFSTKNLEGMTMGIMEITQSNSYDLKYISSSDISYNPALGSGQIQLRDVHYVSLETRNVWEFCQILDRKCIASKKGFAHWFAEAKKHGWIKSATGLYEY